VAKATQRRVLARGLRRAAAPAVGACLLVLVATAGAQTAPGTAAVDEPTAIADATTVATGQFVSIAEGIGVADGTGAVSGQSVTVGESVGISDGTGTMTGQVVNIGEGVRVDDGTDAVTMNASPIVLVGELNGDEGSAAAAAGSFTDPDHGPWTAVADYGDGTPTQPVALQPDKTFTLSHVYDDDGANLVTVTVTDGAGGSGTASASVSIDNVAPDATLTGGSGDEGVPVTVSFSDQTDPSGADTAAGFMYRYACDGVTLGPVTADATASCTFDDDGSHTVLARIADKDGGHSDHTAEVTVANVVPTGVLVTDGPVVEGAPATISWSAQSDPSTADTAAGFTYRYACDGVTLGPETTDATATCAFTEDGTYTILARIADKDGGFTDITTDVVVENAAPTGELANDGPIGEGASATISWSGQSDPSPADSAAGFTYRYACDGVTLGPETSNSTTTCSFDDGPGTYSVLARIADADGGFTDRTTDVAVLNAPPSATLGNDGPVAEGSAATISFSGQADPSSADTAAGFTYRYACEGVTLGAPTYDTSAACAFDDGPGTYTVLARITDKDGGFTDLTTTVSVTNVAPTGRLVLPAAAVDEGSTFTLAVADLADPSADDTSAGFTVEFDCGAGFAAAATCTARDDPAQGVRARIVDKDGGATILTGSVPVANLAPSVAITSPPTGSLYQVGQPVTFSGYFSDPGKADTHTATWSFDGIDRGGTVTESGGSGTASLVTSFAAPGVYSVTLTVEDDDGGVGNASTVDGLPAFVVVYDASAGFVMGGGWITSPAGAYAPSPAATDKATFGFVAKYKTGANKPDGNTEFDFKAGGFEFRSTSYDWLVVAGSKAQYRGEGTVNGAAGYGFLMTAYDGSPDRLRLKVWDASHAVVYDNRPGASDDVDAADPQALGGGSIVVHRK
jgi:PKD domain